MNIRLKEILIGISQEEQAILNGDAQVRRELYSAGGDFVADSGKLLRQGRLIGVRRHTRFV